MLKLKNNILLLFLCIAVSFGQVRFNDLTNETNIHEEYRNRREKLIGLLDSNSAVIMKSADYKVRSNDVNYQYRQESNFLYLTGLAEPDNYLLIIPKGIEVEGKSVRTLFFVSPKNKWGIGDIDYGEVVLTTDKFHNIFKSILPNTKHLYVSSPDLILVNDWLNDKRYFTERNAKKELTNKYPGLEFESITGLVAKLREIKSDYEIEQIKKAIQITGDGIRRAMEICKPGVYEYELQAAIEYEMTRQGAGYTAFPSIIGSGENSLIYHYDKNSRKTKTGDLAVMDVGAEYNGYAADITRTIPVSGKFTREQAEVYQIVLDAQKEVIKMIKPGVKMRDLNAKAKDFITWAGFGKYYKHSVSHQLGIDVHDIWSSDTLKAGMVITVEPGIYIPANDNSVSVEFRGWGIRIEDDILVTETDYEVLSKDMPKEIIELEILMRKRK